MNLEEARNNIGAEVEALGELKSELNKFNAHDIFYIKSVDTHNEKVIIESNDGRTVAVVKDPRHLKLKTQNYKIHVPTEGESREAQELFFELGYIWRSGNAIPKYNSYSCVFTVGKIITVTDFAEEGKKINARQITLQDLRNMVAKKKGKDKTVQVTGTFTNFEPRKEMTWEDAFQALIDGKEVQMLDIYNQWENIKDFYVSEIMEKGNKFRIVTQRITLNGEYTKEELLQKAGEME